MSETIEELRLALAEKNAELLKIKLELINKDIETLQISDADQETRLRTVEESRIKFETLVALTFGGGAVALVNLFILLGHLIGKL